MACSADMYFACVPQFRATQPFKKGELVEIEIEHDGCVHAETGRALEAIPAGALFAVLDGLAHRLETGAILQRLN